MYRPQYLNREYETIEYWDHNGYNPVQRRMVVQKSTWRKKKLNEVNSSRRKIHETKIVFGNLWEKY